MYSPPDNNEWIELYNPNNDSINLTGWLLEDNKSEDEIVCCSFVNNCSLILENNSYAIITDQDSSLYSHLQTESLKVCVDDNSIGNGLGDSGDSIKVYNNLSEGNSFTYDKSMGGHKNNKTLEINKDSQWKESLFQQGTPGEKNSVYEFSYDYSVLEITEFLSDPFEDDDSSKPLGEWVELYNSGDEPIYLDGLYLYDNTDNHELKITAVNCNNLELFPQQYSIIYRDGDSDFALNNDADTVRLYTGYPLDENLLIDEVTYTNNIEGMSFSKVNDNWYRTVPTPEKENIYTAGCDWQLNLISDNSIYHSEDLELKVTLQRNYGEKQTISVKGKIEDIFGMSIKNYVPWTEKEVTTTISKVYTPNLKDGVYQISFWLENLTCTDKNLDDNRVTKLIAINPQYQESDSLIEIERLYLGSDEEAEWGDQFTTKVNLYKGEESRYSAQLWAEMDGEKVSKTTRVSLFDKYKHYPLTLPIQLEPNCNNKIDDGEAILVIEAFGLRTEQEFDIADVDSDVCRDYLSYVKELEKETSKGNKLNNFQIVDIPSSISPGEIFKVKVQLLNNKAINNYKVWGYLYRGSKCYSCEEGSRNSNLQGVILQSEEAKVVDLLLKADSTLKEGEYNLKIIINKNGQKTNKELKEKMIVQEKETFQSNSEEDNSQEYFSNQGMSSEAIAKKKQIIDNIDGVIVYESSSEKAKKLIPVFLAFTFALVCIVILIRKA